MRTIVILSLIYLAIIAISNDYYTRKLDKLLDQNTKDLKTIKAYKILINHIIYRCDELEKQEIGKQHNGNPSIAIRKVTNSIKELASTKI